MIDYLTFAPIEANLSMTMLEKFARCRKRWQYRYAYGLEPKGLPEYVWIGSAFHAGAAEGYRTWKRDGHNRNFLSTAHKGVFAWNVDNPGKLSPENLSLVGDMLTYWWLHEGYYEDYSEIIAVEESIPLFTSYSLGGLGEPKIVAIRCTPDLIARRASTGKLVVPDHKTVGSIGESLAFLPIDFQLRAYNAAVFRKYGEIPEMDYNLVKRGLPPDFIRPDGSKPYSLTKTGKTSTRSAKKEDHVYRLRQVFTLEAVHAFESDLSDLVTDMALAWYKQRFPRTRIKKGGDSCNICEYLPICTAELDGKKLSGLDLAGYNKDATYAPAELLRVA
ncbi:MAG: PD-(D/E)XK nuclease family protein [Patescibacteria group bacterium]|nr:PD-(D/E)XK nuclease family protein [Patescibacteria group bacterium]